jgi:hypothetical protein
VIKQYGIDHHKYFKRLVMQNSDFFVEVIRNLMTLVRELKPDIVWREHHNVDDIMEDANKAIFILKRGE